MQDVFAAIFVKIDDFNHMPGHSFRGWVATITSNKIADHFRDNNQKPQAAGEDAACEQLLRQTIQQIGQDDDNDASILLWRAVEQIRADFQENVFQAFWLGTIDCLTESEIAEQLDMAPIAIQQAKFRVRRRLRVVYGDLVS